MKQKIKSIYIGIIVIVSSLSCGLLSKSQKATTSFTVSGNCEMCTERIVNSLDLKGIYSSYYDLKAQKVFITYNSLVFKEEQLHNIIAAVGHDTEKVKADNVVYSNLPDCCKYRQE